MYCAATCAHALSGLGAAFSTDRRQANPASGSDPTTEVIETVCGNYPASFRFRILKKVIPSGPNDPQLPPDSFSTHVMTVCRCSTSDLAFSRVSCASSLLSILVLGILILMTSTSRASIRFTRWATSARASRSACTFSIVSLCTRPRARVGTRLPVFGSSEVVPHLAQIPAILLEILFTFLIGCMRTFTDFLPRPAVSTLALTTRTPPWAARLGPATRSQVMYIVGPEGPSPNIAAQAVSISSVTTTLEPTPLCQVRSLPRRQRRIPTPIASRYRSARPVQRSRYTRCGHHRSRPEQRLQHLWCRIGSYHLFLPRLRLLGLNLGRCHRRRASSRCQRRHGHPHHVPRRLRRLDRRLRFGCVKQDL